MKSVLSIAVVASLLSGMVAAFPLLEKRSAVADCATTPSACPKKGPSGSLITPAGGATFSQTQLYGGDGAIHVQYKTVNQNSPYTVYTENINVSLQGIAGAGNYQLAALAPPTQGAEIDAYLSTPAGACGEFYLVVEEQQYYNDTPGYGAAIKFRSAAPTISINCAIQP